MRRPKNFKKSPTCFDKTVVLLSSVKRSGIFFQILVNFSEKMDFKSSHIEISLYLFIKPFCFINLLKYWNAPSENPSTHCARLLKNVIRLVACETTALFLHNGGTFFLKLNSQFSQRYCQSIQIHPRTALF